MQAKTAIFFSLGLAILFSGCGKKTDEYTVKPIDIDYTILANCTVSNPEPYDIKALQSGDIKKVNVREGEAVKKGSLLVQLDDFKEQQNLLISSANLENARLKLQNADEDILPRLKGQLKEDELNFGEAKKAFDRSQELVKSEAITKSEYEQAENRFMKAGLKVKQTKIQLDSFGKSGDAASLKNQLSGLSAQVELDRKNAADKSIKAPYDGVITKINIKAGENIRPEAVILTIIEKMDWVLETNVDQKELPFVALGIPALIAFDAYPAEKVKAEVVFVCASIDLGKGTCNLKLKIKENKSFIKYGMTGSAELQAKTYKNVLAVPSRFVIKDKGESFIYVKEGNSASRVKAECSQVGEKWIILKDVKEGTIITTK
ncbi:MAG: efflux RND transporter periplasmic adaptor subunit [Candidatus Firestonebacteria bacterium]